MVVSISYIKSIHSISHCSMFSILWIFFFFFLRLVYYRLFETTVVLYMFLSSHLRLFITFFITLGQLSGTLTCVLFCFSLTYLTSHTLLLNFFHFSQKPLWNQHLWTFHKTNRLILFLHPTFHQHQTYI